MKNIEVVRVIQNLIMETNAANCKMVNKKRMNEGKVLTPEEKLLTAIFGEDNHLSYHELKAYSFNEFKLYHFREDLKRVVTRTYDKELKELKTEQDVFKWLGSVQYPVILTSKFVSWEKEYESLLETKEFYNEKVDFRMRRLVMQREQNAPQLIIDNETRMLEEAIFVVRLLTKLINFIELNCYPKNKN